MVCLCLCQQFVKIREGPILRVYILIVRDVVAAVALGRRLTRRAPDSVDTKSLQVIQSLTDAIEVANPIAVAILEAARIDFVDHGMFPPRPIAMMHRIGGMTGYNRRVRLLRRANATKSHRSD